MKSITKNRKGIILAGGTGSRLYPLTKIISKQLLPVFDKPMIFYPLSTLMCAGIKEVLIISDQFNLPLYKKIFGNGENFGITIKYKIQFKPNGIAESILIAENFLNGSPSALILGDNIFAGKKFTNNLSKINSDTENCHIFLKPVRCPQRFGVPHFDSRGNIKKIIEKPHEPCSKFAVTGLYFFNENAVNLSKKLTYSKRGELEITDLLNLYINKNQNLNFTIMDKNTYWYDTGTFDSLLEASIKIKNLRKRKNKIGEIDFLLK